MVRAQASLRAALGSAALALVLTACSRDEGPCYGLSIGDRYRIELLEVYDETSSFEFDLGQPVPPTCGEDFDLHAGDVLTVRVVGHIRDDSCDLNVVELESPPPWDLGPRRSRFPLLGSVNGQIMDASYSASIAGCPGRWGFEVQGRREPNGAEGNPFVTPEPGGFPPILLARGFIPDEVTPECAAFLPASGAACVDFFVAVVERA